MATATTSIFKPSPAPVSDSSSLLSLPSLLSNPSKAPCLSIPPRQMKLHLSHYLALKPRKQFPSFLTFAAQTSEWAQNEEDSSTITFNGQETGSELEEDQPTWDNQDSDGAEAELSNWEGEGQDVAAEESGAGGEFGGLYEEPSEDAKLFVGNLPNDVDSQTLAMHFEKAGTVEIAEVIYNRETDQSRGFGFVTMSSVEEADKAAEMLNRYELNGRLLTVNKAAPRGSRPERPARVYEPSFRIYVGNLPWDVDNARLEQLFSEHGKVVDARIVSDWETGRSRGFGFVTMSSETELNDAIAALDGQNVDGRTIRVNVAEERPRRSF